MSSPVLRRALMRITEAVEDWTIAARADLLPAQFVPMYRFTDASVIEKFHTTTDKVLGGASTASFKLKQYDAFQAAVFEGIIDYQDDNPNTRGGFAAVRSRADDKVRDLHTCAALEMRVKTDGRPYILNVKSADASPDQLWQMRLLAPPFKWTTLACPFHELILTKRGNLEVTQFPVNTEAINGIGILLADGCNGPFKFEVQYVRGVRDFNQKDYALVVQETARTQVSSAAREREASREQHRLLREQAKLK